MRNLSTLQLLGLPSEYGAMLLFICTLVTIAPFFPESDFGSFRIPALTPEWRKKLKVIGPAALSLLILLHVPFWSKEEQQLTEAEAQMTPKVSPPVPVSTQPEVKPHSEDNPTAPLRETHPQERRPRRDMPPVRSAYKVHLLVPTTLTAPSVRVNGDEAPIITRTANVITIEVSSGLTSYQIEVEGGDGRTCSITAALAQDGETLTLCQS